MTSSASIKRRLDRLEQLVARLRRLPTSLDVVDLLTLIELSTGRGGDDVDELAMTRIQDRPAPTEAKAFHGCLKEIPPYALLQVLELGRKTGVLELDGKDGTGRLWLRDGSPIHAETQEQVGFDEFGKILDLYFGGDMEASIALSGQVVGRIESVRPVAEILRETLEEFQETARTLGAYAATA